MNDQLLIKSGKSSESLNYFDFMSLESLVTFFYTDKLTSCSI